MFILSDEAVARMPPAELPPDVRIAQAALRLSKPPRTRRPRADRTLAVAEAVAAAVLTFSRGESRGSVRAPSQGSIPT